MAKIRYKNANNQWAELSASDIGAATDNIVLADEGSPSNKAQLDTKLYIDTLDNITSDTSIIMKSDEQSWSTPLSTTIGGTGVGVNNIAELKTLMQPDKSWILDNIYPIGSIYLSTTGQNPKSIFGGGTWIQVSQGRFLAGVKSDTTDTQALNITNATVTGGQKQVTLTSNQVPLREHSHSFSGNLPDHKHNFTQPQIGGGNGKPADGAHRHTVRMTQNAASGTAHNIPNSGGKSSTDQWIETTSGNLTGTHTHKAYNGAVEGMTSTPAISGTISDTSITNVSPHDIIPPYFSVYIWQRIG